MKFYIQTENGRIVDFFVEGAVNTRDLKALQCAVTNTSESFMEEIKKPKKDLLEYLLKNENVKAIPKDS